MIVVGLTGGIGSGKSTVARLLAGHGAAVIDADQVARDLQQPGSPMVGAMVAEFGSSIVDAAGVLDRGAVAKLVFGDSDQARANLAKLNAVTHPAIHAEIVARLDQLASTDSIVVLDHPLLVAKRSSDDGRTDETRTGLEGGSSPAKRDGSPANPSAGTRLRDRVDVLVVVDVPVEVQVQRLVARGLDVDDAKRRIASQSTRDERLAVADFVVDNAGDQAALAVQVDGLWNELQHLDFVER